MKALISRRKLLRRCALGAAAATLTVDAAMKTPAHAASGAPPASPEPVSVSLSRRIRLHMFQTGWVAVKRSHRAFDGPAGLRLPAIMADRRWTEWMPITAFAIEHPDGLYVVDTGETSDIVRPDYAACDTITGLFYRRNLRFIVDRQDEIGLQMQRVGLAPERVSAVVMTHLHSDHMGGMGWFEHAPFLISEASLNGHSGALMCRVPSAAERIATAYAERTAGAFTNSHALTRDGAISIVPTPGHTTGHQSVLIEDEGKSVCIAGDAAFSRDQVLAGGIAGIVEDRRAAISTIATLKTQLDAFRTALLPCHDAGNRSRLMSL